MQGHEILRIVDAIHREKDIDKEIIFEGIESALNSAAKKKYGLHRVIDITVDRETGEIGIDTGDGDPVDPIELGRIAAQTAKQMIIQRIREAERDVVFKDFINRKNDIVVGNVLRFDGPNVIVNLGRTEGILPRKEQVVGERYHPGDRIRAFVLDVAKKGPRVKIVLSRSHPDFIRRLFELEVPEIGQKIIEIHNLVREVGYRTKIAVSSIDSRVDCVGACVGVRGSRIKNIIEELGGEKIDIIRWNDSTDELIKNALKPAEVLDITLDREQRRALVLVDDDQLSLAIGKKGQNVRLASKLAGWEIDIKSRSQKQEEQGKAMAILQSIPGIGHDLAERLFFLGLKTPRHILKRGVETLASVGHMETEQATEIIEYIEDYLEQLASGLVNELGEPIEEAVAPQAPGDQTVAEGGAAGDHAEAPGTTVVLDDAASEALPPEEIVGEGFEPSEADRDNRRSTIDTRQSSGASLSPEEVVAAEGTHGTGKASREA